MAAASRFIAPVVLGILLLGLLEVSFRVYLFGLTSLNPFYMNSFTQIHRSGITKPGSIPELTYELQANYSGIYKGTPFTTNSIGLRDQEYPLEKPINTYRVAVLGSSWTMGSGVKEEDIWHSVLETHLNKQSFSNQKFEFINFGVDQYGLGEIVATLDNKVARYSPDLVLICITHFTPTILWTEQPETYIQQPPNNPFFDFWSLRVIDSKLGLELFTQDSLRPQTKTKADVKRQLKKAQEHFAAFSAQTGTPVVMAKLAYTPRWKKESEEVIEKTSLTQESSDPLVYFEILESIEKYGYSPNQLRVSIWDSHPNPLGHRLIANAVLENLIAQGFLPASSTAIPLSNE